MGQGQHGTGTGHGKLTVASEENTMETAVVEVHEQRAKVPSVRAGSWKRAVHGQVPLRPAWSVGESNLTRAPAPVEVKVAESSSGAGVRSVETVTWTGMEKSLQKWG